MSPAHKPLPHAKVPSHDARRIHRLPPMGRLRREVAPSLVVAMARGRADRRRRPLLAQHREPFPGARIVPRDPGRRGPRQPAPADRRRPGRRPCDSVQGTAVHPVPPRPRLLPVLLPERVRGGRTGCRDRRRVAGGGDRRELRAGPRRGQQPAQPGDRRPGVLRRPGSCGRPRDRVREGIALQGDPPGRETFPGPRGHVRRLARRIAGRPGGMADAPAPRTAPLPPRRARGDPGADDRPRDVPRARPRPAGHAVPEDPSRPPAETVAVPRSGLLRRARDEGDLGSVRHCGGVGPRRDGRVRRRARVPGGIGAGGDDRPAGQGDPGPAYVPAGGRGGGDPVGAASGVGGGERTLSSGAAGGGGGTASASFFPPAGGLGKYRANISGR